MMRVGHADRRERRGGHLALRYQAVVLGGGDIARSLYVAADEFA
jgi:hypothetical protein